MVAPSSSLLAKARRASAVAYPSPSAQSAAPAGDATSRNDWGGTPAAMAYGEFVPGIHSVVVDPHNPDGAKTWKRVSQQDIAVHFGFLIAVDANDGRFAWIVPAIGDDRPQATQGDPRLARLARALAFRRNR